MKNSCLITTLTHTQSVRVIVQKTAAVALAAVMAVMTAGCGVKGQPASDATGTKDGTDVYKRQMECRQKPVSGGDSFL